MARKRLNEPKSKRKRLYDDLPFPKDSNKGAVGSPENRHESVYSDKCSPLEEKFIQAYLANHRRAETAAILAGIGARSAAIHARGMLRRPRVQQRLAELELDSLKRQQLDADKLIRTEYLLATTSIIDELYNVIVPPCRFCWGENNRFQYTHGEQEKRFDDYMSLSNKAQKAKGPLDAKGGSGFDIDADPNPDCPHCFGRGDVQRPIIVPKPLHEVSMRGRMMIGGIKLKDGMIEYQIRDQDGALRAINNGMRAAALLKETPEGNRIIDITPSQGGKATELKRIARITHYFVHPKKREDALIDGEDDE